MGEVCPAAGRLTCTASPEAAGFADVAKSSDDWDVARMS